MISFQIDDASIDLIPFIKGLCSEADKVAAALDSKTYEAAGVALGFEDIEAIRRRAEIEGEFQPSELDEIYSYFLKDFGQIDMPDPASTRLIDLCYERKIPVNPLDMNDEEFSELYCKTVSTWEFVRENRMVKKAFRTEFDKSSPEAFVDQWDSLMNKLKGNAKLNLIREEYIAEQIKTLSKYRKSILVLVERERVNGVLRNLGVDRGL